MRRGEVGRRLRADLAVREPCLSVREQPAKVADGLGELPGRARAREPGPLCVGREARGAVVANAALDEELIPEIERRLPEVALGPDLRLDVLGRREGRRVAQVERRVGDQPVAHLALLPEAPGVEVLPEAERPLHLRAQRVARGAEEVAVPLGVNQRLLDHLTARVGGVRAGRRLALEPAVLTVVHAERVAQLEPGPRREVHARCCRSFGRRWTS